MNDDMPANGASNDDGGALPPAHGSGKVVLVGPRAAGKTTLGRALAGELGVVFHDSDDLLAAAAGQPAEDCLRQQGEERFREIERRVCLDALASPAAAVLALGGGAVLAPDVRAALDAARSRRRPPCFVVFVHADLDVLVARQQAAPRTPLTEMPLAQEVASLLAARRELYREVCDVELDTSSANVPACIRSIMGKMGES